jgi:hypothetical protein
MGEKYGYKLLRENVQRSIDVSERSLPSVVADDNFLFYYCLFIMYKLTSLAEKVGARISDTIRFERGNLLHPG